MKEIFGKFTPTKIQLQEMNLILAENPNIISLNELLKINKALYYLMFSIKELIEYFNRKTESGELILNCKKVVIDLNSKVLELESLK